MSIARFYASNVESIFWLKLYEICCCLLWMTPCSVSIGFHYPLCFYALAFRGLNHFLILTKIEVVINFFLTFFAFYLERESNYMPLSLNKKSLHSTKYLGNNLMSLSIIVLIHHDILMCFTYWNTIYLHVMTTFPS